MLRSGAGGIGLRELLDRVSVPQGEIQELLRKMIERGDLLLIDPDKLRAIDMRQYQQLREMARAQLKDFLQKFPMKSGLAKEELRTKLPPEMDVKLFQILLNGLIQSGEVILEKDKLKLKEHRVSSGDEKGLLKRIEEAMLKGGLQPASSRELSEEWIEDEEAIRQILEHLAHEGILVKVKGGMYFHRTHIEHLKEKLIAYLKKNREINTTQFKEITGVSRKFSIPLIEYLDQTKLTLRLGEKRVLRSGATQG
ncbi:MAG: hypothetical protein EHM36_03700 [Deltaproteobacteria bacterium]|nr:MAG: hypothetical protein EHM36_03700 [Deltaproteobacteria bacterium]